jgi:hypothetical protein
MKKSYVLFIFPCLVFLSACSSHNDTVQVGENTFVSKNRVYKIIDNEIRIIGDLKSDSIKLFQIIKPVKRNFGNKNLNYIKEGAYANLNALYRGSILYYHLEIEGFNDLKEAYLPGTFTIEFEDEFGFILHSTAVSTAELIGLVNNSGAVEQYSYNGKTEMSTEIYRAIQRYSITSTIKPKSKFSYW